MTYNYPANVTGFSSLMTYVNTEIGGILGIGLLFAIVFISMLALIQWGSDRAFASTSVIGLVTALFLRYMGLLNEIFVYLFLVLMMISAVWLYKNSTSE